MKSIILLIILILSANQVYHISLNSSLTVLDESMGEVTSLEGNNYSIILRGDVRYYYINMTQHKQYISISDEISFETEYRGLLANEILWVQFNRSIGEIHHKNNTILKFNSTHHHFSLYQNAFEYRIYEFFNVHFETLTPAVGDEGVGGYASDIQHYNLTELLDTNTRFELEEITLEFANLTTIFTNGTFWGIEYDWSVGMHGILFDINTSQSDHNPNSTITNTSDDIVEATNPTFASDLESTNIAITWIMFSFIPVLLLRKKYNK